MKINNKKSLKKPLIVISSLAILLLGSVTSYAYIQKLGPFKETNFSAKPASPDEKNAGQTTKKSSLEQSTDKKGGTGSDPLPDPTPDPNGGKPVVGMEITAANQSDGTFNVRTLIQTVTSSGTCSLRMTGPNGNIYTATADVQAMPSSSTCKGFDVSTANLMAGDWTVSVAFENDELKGTASKEVTIN